MPTNTPRPVELPQPDETQKQRSLELCALIANSCEQQGGAISFGEFMQAALYQPGLGYYSGGLQKFGEHGDFITAPEVSPLFSRCIARQLAQVLAQMEHAVVIEFGAGSGVMAAEILLELERLNCLPESYRIIELSAELRARQKLLIDERAAHLAHKLEWLDSLPGSPVQGVVIANEVLDAMPVECFRIAADSVEQLNVRTDGDQLSACYDTASDELVKQVRTIEERRENPLPDGYCSEVNPSIAGWLQSIARFLDKGMVLLVDYGYPASEYYLDERNHGTLICHYRHHAHSDALWYPGLQDITAFVDFTAVAYAAVDAGFDVSGYTSQAMFLMGCGLGELHAAEVNDDVTQQLLLSQQIKTLTLPSEMGERFKAMALTKEFDEPLIGFMQQDYRNRL
jgi:SAM-dependent MidA family methyltransferase